MKRFLISLFFIFFIIVFFQEGNAACSCSACNDLYEHNMCGKLKYKSYGASGHKITCCGGKVLSSITSAHVYTGTATCTTSKKCRRCGYSVKGSHSYTKTCSKTHCSVKTCAYCGTHKTSCGGGCSTTNCSHCGKKYCKKSNCPTYAYHKPYSSCPCNTKKSCSNAHCAGIRWCSYCGSHTHKGCTFSATCSKAHCKRPICKVCGKHKTSCGGGHVYEWVTNSTTNESQTHIKECSVGSCTVTSGSSHKASWGVANTSHTSTCKTCKTIKYTHPAKWSTENRTATEAHPCAWHLGCKATHAAKWGEYYKVGGGTSGDTDQSNHTRICSVCKCKEYEHQLNGEWKYQDKEDHIIQCATKNCGLKAEETHYTGGEEDWVKKAVNDETHEELYNHWRICTKCNQNEIEKTETNIKHEQHIENGHGICEKCGQTLWKIIESTKDGQEGNNITEAIIKEEMIRAKQEETIKIIEKINQGTEENPDPTTKYIKDITGQETLAANQNNVITITQNGKYQFTTGRGGTAEFTINNISREILIDKIIEPITSTTETVTIVVRTNKAEEKYDKEVVIKDVTEKVLNGDPNPYEITDEELENGGNPGKDKQAVQVEKEVSKNGTYYFVAKDSAGNEEKIEITIENIIKGQATVAISNDVFTGGYIFTEILINPTEEWEIEKQISEIVKASIYKTEGNDSGVALSGTNIKLIKIMDMQRNDVKPENGVYPPGSYYIQLAIGGDKITKAGTYIVDLDKVLLYDSEAKKLPGKNRITIEVQGLKDLT